MVLDLLEPTLNGDEWEKLSISFYRMRYQSNHFHEVPAAYKGDAGIEGFTKNGVVIQCYCPDDPNLSKNDLYSNQRDKITGDINKLINKDNAKILEEIGVLCIKEWHFVIPKYLDRRILAHINTKKKLVLDTKKTNLKLYDYISEDFDIHIKVADDFKLEISTLLRKDLGDLKLDFTALEKLNSDWSLCGTDKVRNVEEKIVAIQPELSSEKEDFDWMLNHYMTQYVAGIDYLERLGENLPDIRKDLMELISTYKNEVKERTIFKPGNVLNSELFQEIGMDFEQRLKEEFPFFGNTSTMELKQKVIAGWLADCSMRFKGD